MITRHGIVHRFTDARQFVNVCRACSASANNDGAVKEPPKRRLLPDDGLTLDSFIAPATDDNYAGKLQLAKGDVRLRLPPWLKRELPIGDPSFKRMKDSLRGLKLTTVCEEARCPNIGECWGGDKADGKASTATIMLLGDKCTRACR